MSSRFPEPRFNASMVPLPDGRWLGPAGERDAQFAQHDLVPSLPLVLRGEIMTTTP